LYLGKIFTLPKLSAMKKYILSLIVFLSFYNNIEAQAPQFAVVRPDGTTYLCLTLDSAYNKAVNGDYIYLPGGTYSFSSNIKKRLFIFGAGHHPDSSLVTGKTNINNHIQIDSGASGGSIEGVNLINSNFYFVYSGKKINGYTIKRSRFNFLHFSTGVSTPFDSFPANVIATECVLQSIDCSNGQATNNYFLKNIIQYQIINSSFCTIKNNVFLYSFNTFAGAISNCTVENNVFLSNSTITSGQGCGSSFYNNLKVLGNPFLLGCQPNAGLEVGTISVPTVNDIFVAFNPDFSNYPYTDNYHLKPTCPGINAGTDGTDVGIYGTAQPTSEGWVPSNPHIYFKQVAPQTNSSGQLQIQFKVRTNN
jgi:hypothetical protein